MKLQKWFLISLFLLPTAVTNANPPSQPSHMRRLLPPTPFFFHVPPRPANYWEGAWCYDSGYRGSHTVAAFKLDGDRNALDGDAYHPGNSVFLFVRGDNGTLTASEEENVSQVVWDEGDSGTFRMRFYQPEIAVGAPDLVYVNLLSSIDGAYGTTQAKRVHYVKTRSIDACLASLNGLQPCECSIK